MSNYNDPENYEEVFENIKNCPTIKEVIEVINKTYPDWIYGFFDGFSKDYPHLDNNWRKVCMQMKVSPSKVMLVKDFDFNNDNMKLINIFCELFTKCGFSIKKEREYIICKNCNLLIPVPEIYERFKNSGFSIPSNWNSECIGNCNRKDSTDL